MNKVISLILLTIFVSLSSHAKQEINWPDSLSTPIFKAFLTAYNANDPEVLSEFSKKYYPEKKAKNKVIYWRKVFSEYGKLSAFKVADAKFRGLPAIWLNGEKSKSWIKMVIMTNKDGSKIKNAGIFRGMRPVGVLPPYQAMSAKNMPEYLSNYLTELVNEDLFSGSVLVAKGNNILFQQAYGYSDKKNKQKNTISTAFGLASTTKNFTAVAIAQLVEQGKLKYTDTLSQHINEYPKDIAEQVTIHHLLTHTSGLEFDDYDPFYYESKKAKNIEQLLAIQLKYIEHMNDERRKDFKVLNRFDYTNDGFILLGAIIERVSGLSYAQYIEKNIFNLANMKQSIADNNKLTTYKNKAIGYSHSNEDMRFELGGRKAVTGSAVIDIIMPAGGTYASTGDLYKYFKALNQGKLLSQDTFSLMQKKHAVKGEMLTEQNNIYYGYGLFLTEHGKAKSIGHNGVDWGVGSRFEYYPEQDIYVIVLSNYGGIAGSNVADHIKDLIEPND